MFGRLKKLDPLAPAPQVLLAKGGREACGKVVVGLAGARQEAVPVEAFTSHVVVTGQPGMGKTTCVCDMVSQLAGHGVSVVVLEPAKVEYAELLTERGLPVKVLGEGGPGIPDEIKINPYAVDSGVKPRVWLQDLTTMVQDAYGMREQPLPLHWESLTRRVYREAGVNLDAYAVGEDLFPTVRDALANVTSYVDEETCSGSEVTQNVKGALMHRARAMCQTPALLSRRGLMSSDLLDFGGTKVVQLSDLGSIDGSFVGMLLLARIIRKSRMLGRRRLHTVIVLEEAHSLLVDALTGEPTMFSRLYESGLAELRASGIGFVTVDQRPSLLPGGVFANSVTKISFASTHGDDREAVKLAFGLDEEQSRRFGGLRAREALFQTGGNPCPAVLRT